MDSYLRIGVPTRLKLSDPAKRTCVYIGVPNTVAMATNKYIHTYIHSEVTLTWTPFELKGCVLINKESVTGMWLGLGQVF